MKKSNIQTIPDGWREMTLGSVADIKYGKDYKKLKDGKYPLYGSGGVMKYVNDFLYDKPSVLIPRKGTLTNLFYIEEPFWTVDTLFYTKIDETKNSPRFLFFKLKTLKLAEMNVGSAVPSLTTDVLNKIVFNLPPLPEQKAIADVLSSFDDKIELLREQNKTLEVTAQTLFKHWFVDFEFPNKDGKPYKSSGGKMIDSELGEIPEGWRVGSVNDVMSRQTLNYRCDKKDLDKKGKVPIIDQGSDGLYGYTSRNADFDASTENPVAIFTNHTCNMWFVNYPFCAIQNVIPFRGDHGYSTFFVYYMTLGQVSFIEYKGHYPDFERKEYVIPTVGVASGFTDIIKPIQYKIWNNTEQIQVLEKTRNTLLPKLMSGEVRVKM